MIVINAILLFTIFDHYGYNVSVINGWVNEKFINPYRIAQGTFQIIITLLLYFFFTPLDALLFNLLWWFWICDWLYHVLCLFNFYDERKYLTKQYFNNILWAWWTPYGLIKWALTGKQKTVIQWQVLLIQSLIGITLYIIFGGYF